MNSNVNPFGIFSHVPSDRSRFRSRRSHREPLTRMDQLYQFNDNFQRDYQRDYQPRNDYDQPRSREYRDNTIVIDIPIDLSDESSETRRNTIRQLLNRIPRNVISEEQFETEAFDPNGDQRDRCPDCKMKTAKKAIHYRIKIVPKESRNTECCICLQNQGVYAKTLDCGHFFHVNCIDNWISEGHENICPLCRGS